MEITDEEHARLKKIEAALAALVSGKGSYNTHVEHAHEALEPAYEPLLSYMELKNGWQRLHSSDDLRIVGATYLEAAADRLASMDWSSRDYGINCLRTWAEAERAI